MTQPAGRAHVRQHHREPSCALFLSGPPSRRGMGAAAGANRAISQPCGLASSAAPARTPRCLPACRGFNVPSLRLLVPRFSLFISPRLLRSRAKPAAEAGARFPSSPLCRGALPGIPSRATARSPRVPEVPSPRCQKELEEPRSHDFGTARAGSGPVGTRGTSTSTRQGLGWGFRGVFLGVRWGMLLQEGTSHVAEGQRGCRGHVAIPKQTPRPPLPRTMVTARATTSACLQNQLWEHWGMERSIPSSLRAQPCCGVA